MSRFVARIAYANTEPFFFNWPLHEYPLVSGVPRELAKTAGSQNDDILAGPLPIVEMWKMESRFEPLENWCIAAREFCPSVLLLSRRPISELDNITIGVTLESSTSVALCEVILKERYGNRITIRRGLERDDEAWLVIGDQALRIFAGPRLGGWDFITDLTNEWWDWQKLPFVFARWVVNKNAPGDERAHLTGIVRKSFNSGMDSIYSISLYQSHLLKIPVQFISEYLRGLIYELGPQEEAGIKKFRSLAEKFQFPSPILSQV